MTKTETSTTKIIKDQTKSRQTQPTLSLDMDYYQTFLDDMDVPEDKKRELVETLWAVVIEFVDMGFGVHPVQRVKTEQTLSRITDNIIVNKEEA